MISVKIVAADCGVILHVEFADPGHDFGKGFTAVANLRLMHGGAAGEQGMGKCVQPFAGLSTDRQGFCLRILIF